jgi:hypothetical protein
MTRALSPFAGGVPLRSGSPTGAYLLAGFLQGMGQQRVAKYQREQGERREQNRRFESAAAYRNRQNIVLSAAERSNRGAALREVRAQVQKDKDREQDTILVPGSTERVEKSSALGQWILAGKSPRLFREPPSPESLVQIMGPNGAPIWVRESDAVGNPSARPARAVTGVERQALSYYNRAKDAAVSVEKLEPSVSGAGVVSQGQLQYAPNVLQTPNQRRYRQAQRAFTEARLRKESGAAIPVHEYENDSKTYFARPGDDPATIEQKRLKRQTVLDGLAFASGRAYEEYYGEPMTKRSLPSGDPVRVRVRGPKGESGTMPSTSALPPGWQVVP